MDSLNFTPEDFETTEMRISELHLEKAMFPVYKVTFSMKDEVMDTPVTHTKYYAFDPDFTFIVAAWKWPDPAFNAIWRLQAI